MNKSYYYKCYYCDNIENVENYEKAEKDNFVGWNCHHRLETHTSDGERRLVDITKKELIAFDMYWHRPPEELIFLTVAEHRSLHLKGKPSWNKGKHHSEEHKRKLSEALKGRPSPNKGKRYSEKTKRKISEAIKGLKPMLGKHHSEETRRKIAETLKGRPKSEETKKRLSEAAKGKHWKLVDGKRVWY